MPASVSRRSAGPRSPVFSRRIWSSVSMMVKLERNPASSACRRSRRAPMAWKVPNHRPSVDRPISSPTLCDISRAALLVKVTARTCQGVARPVARMRASRTVSTRVLPVPAPARTRTGPSSASAAWRWDSLSRASRSPGAPGGALSGSETVMTGGNLSHFSNRGMRPSGARCAGDRERQLSRRP